MKVMETNASLDDLAALNQFLQSMQNNNLLTPGTAAVPLVAGAFAQGTNATAAEIDEAVANADYWLSNQWVVVDDVVEAIDTALNALVADPEGYEAVENANVWAYINTGAFAPDDQAIKLLVSAAHGLGESLHRSSNMSGLADDTPYVHLYGPNTLWAFSEDGDHRGYPKITVIAQGKVNAGEHRF